MSEPSAGAVVQLLRYPVKSLLGESVDALELDLRGVRDDRRWAIYDEAGKLGSGKTTRRFRQLDGLFALSARLLGDRPEVAFPDGRRLCAGDPGLDAALSETLGLPVRLGQEAGVPHHDAAPLHLVTSATLRAFGEALGEGPADVRRFRPNLVLDLDTPGFSEAGWLGRTLCVGETVQLTFVKETERCRMIGLAQRELPAAPRLLKRLGERNHACLGVYAEVRVPGPIRAGDPVFWR